jgi:hypothetical protein
MRTLFTTSDGKIPFLQIFVSLIIGAVAMFLYAKIYKPKILFESIGPATMSDAVAAALPRPAPQQISVPATTVVPASVEPSQQPSSFLDMQDMAHMPKLPHIYRQDDYTNEDDEEDEEEDAREATRL